MDDFMNENMHLLNIANAEQLKALPFPIQVGVAFGICAEEIKGWANVDDDFIAAIRGVVERMRAENAPQLRNAIKFMDACLDFREKIDAFKREEENADKPFYQDPSTN